MTEAKLTAAQEWKTGWSVVFAAFVGFSFVCFFVICCQGKKVAGIKCFCNGGCYFTLFSFYGISACIFLRLICGILKTLFKHVFELTHSRCSSVSVYALIVLGKISFFLIGAGRFIAFKLVIRLNNLSCVLKTFSRINFIF